MIRAFLLACILSLFATAPWAHETTRSYLQLQPDKDSLTGEISIALRDLEVLLWIDADLDGAITRAELSERIADIATYIGSAVTIATDAPCQSQATAPRTEQRDGIAYLTMSLMVRCAAGSGPVRITSRLLAEIDPDHRLFLTINSATGPTSLVLRRDSPPGIMDQGSLLATAASYFQSGVAHLLAGPDHIVFLLLLILPAVTRDQPSLRSAREIVAAVTGFTIAHALTLSLATFSLFHPPARVIENLIALSVLVTAIDNLRPFLPGPRAAPAAFFGLIHGFGFASVLGTTGLTPLPFSVALVSFNLGIEAAQIIVVVATGFALHALGARRCLLIGGSLAGAVASLLWLTLHDGPAGKRVVLGTSQNAVSVAGVQPSDLG